MDVDVKRDVGQAKTSKVAVAKSDSTVAKSVDAENSTSKSPVKGKGRQVARSLTPDGRGATREALIDKLDTEMDLYDSARYDWHCCAGSF